MSNEYYSHTGYPAQSADGDSVDARAELLAVQAGFDKLPPLTTNGNKLVVVNSSGDALGVMGFGRENIGLTAWTPTITCATPGDLTVAYSIREGSQYRLGGIIITHFSILTSTWTHTTASGTLILEGFPVASVALSKSIAAIGYGGMTKAGYHSMTAEAFSNASQIFFYASGSAVGMAQLNVTDFPTVGPVLLRGSFVQGG